MSTPKLVISPEELVKKQEAKTLSKGLRAYKPRSTEARLSLYDEDAARAELAQKQRIVLFDPGCGIYVQPGFVIVGGVSGKGKSNVTGNLAGGYIKNGGKKPIIILSNEESSAAIYDRIACVQLDYNFYSLKNGTASPKMRRDIKEAVAEIAKQVEIITDGDFKTDTYEDVLSVMEYVVGSDAGLFIGDYWQNVNTSREEPQMETFRLSKRMGFKMKELGERATIPIVWLAQMSSASGKGASAIVDVKERVENDKSLFNHCHQFIDLTPDFETSTTTFKVWKDRYGGTQGQEVVMKFVGGRYEYEGTI